LSRIDFVFEIDYTLKIGALESIIDFNSQFFFEGLSNLLYNSIIHKFIQNINHFTFNSHGNIKLVPSIVKNEKGTKLCQIL